MTRLLVLLGLVGVVVGTAWAERTAWFFAVEVDELWYRYDTQPRNMGGFSHAGPYKTRADCEKGRVEMSIMYSDSSHWYRYKPQPCRLDDLDAYERGYKEELRRMGVRP